ncbi:GNAT family N-acetyltransferase [Gracilibacillus sp. S3-1-1]|uniref:GNAT family N-acetyltransferase n=1 Tax=Gracilibacillus pellucidus TaxID=3095368 RepID=A0ACC6M4F2_9BACI|nr:GNAT family N-acetyltransferase [Gracilibacillus sp. S3-1-1]MDX8045791.1 GNAT family N-acetyltransferase [Gracilibacillus sp. S3-1-1]
MNWYEKLNQYFPVEEMKSKQHMEILLKEKSDIYYKDEGKYHVMMYAEFPTFLFIDYVYVSQESRGQGIGHQLIEKLKKKNKPIILEVEPYDYQDSDSTKRLHFYKREGFKHAVSIGYTRKSLATNKHNTLEILYWSPTAQNEEEIYEQMKKLYEDIHTYKDKELYGKSYQPVEEVLSYDDNREANNIFDMLENKSKENN